MLALLGHQAGKRINQRFVRYFNYAKHELSQHTGDQPWTKEGHWIWVIVPQDDEGGHSAPDFGFNIDSGGKYAMTTEQLTAQYKAYIRQLRHLGEEYVETWTTLFKKIMDGSIVVPSGDTQRVRYVRDKLTEHGTISLDDLLKDLFASRAGEDPDFLAAIEASRAGEGADLLAAMKASLASAAIEASRAGEDADVLRAIEASLASAAIEASRAGEGADLLAGIEASFNSSRGSEPSERRRGSCGSCGSCVVSLYHLGSLRV